MSSYSERVKNRRSSSGKTKPATTANTYEDYLAAYERRGKRGSGFKPLTREEWESRESRGTIRGRSGAKRGVGETVIVSAVEEPKIVPSSEPASPSQFPEVIPTIEETPEIASTPTVNTGPEIETLVEQTDIKEPYSVFDDPRFMSARDRAQKRIKDVNQKRREYTVIKKYGEYAGMTPEETKSFLQGSVSPIEN